MSAIPEANIICYCQTFLEFIIHRRQQPLRVHVFDPRRVQSRQQFDLLLQGLIRLNDCILWTDAFLEIYESFLDNC